MGLPSVLPFIALGVAVLLVLPLDPELSYVLVRNTTVTPQEIDTDYSNHLYTRSTTFVESNGEKMHTWLYLPNNPGPDAPPAVIMAQGLGAQKDLGMHKYADRFASAGIAVIAFDYRTFGGSDGEPRNWASPYRHLDDWWAVVQHVQATSLDGRVNPKKLALWGSSYSGGHVLVTAAKMGGNVSAVISQVPHLAGSEAIMSRLRNQGLLRPIRTLLAGAHDIVRSSVGLSPAYIKTVGLQHELALMAMSPDGLKAYFARHPEVYMGGWRPLVRARLVLEHSSYSPIKYVSSVQAPILFVGATHDTICPPSIVRRASNLQNTSSYFEVNSSHFAIYAGQPLQDIMQRMTDFLKEKLLPGGAAAESSLESGSEPVAQAA